MATYEKWNKDNTVRLSTIINPDALKLSKMVGYLLVTMPVIDEATEKLGKMTFTPGSPFGERSWEVIAKTQTELDEYQAEQDAAALAEANEVLLESLELSGNLDVWEGMTDQEVVDYFASRPETFAAVISDNRKIARALTDVIKIIGLWQTTGRVV